MKKINIVHVITGLNVGGAERMLYMLLTAASSSKYEYLVVSLTGDGFYGPHLRSLGVNLVSIELRKSPSTALRLVSLLKHIAKFKPDIVQGWMYHGNLIATFAGLFVGKGCKISWNVRQSLDGDRSLSKLTTIINLVLARISFVPDLVINNSVRSIEQHRALGYSNKNTVYIPNGFNTSQFSFDPKMSVLKRQSLQVKPETIVIGYVGRRHVQKAIPLLLTAFTQAAKFCDNIYLVCIGKDIDLEVNSGHSERILCLGHKSNVNEYMSAFDVLCLPSLWEGFPNVVGEAMASSIPCIVSDVGDAADIVADSGWVIQPNSLDQLVNAFANVSYLSRDDLKIMGSKARQRILDKYSIDVVYEMYNDAYQNLFR